MRLNTLLIGLYLFSGGIQANPVNPVQLPHEITKKNLRTHVRFLCSDALEGRLTGSIGEKLAAQYVANIFRDLGLEPAGSNGTFFQAFNFTAGVSLGKNNLFTIKNQKGEAKNLQLDREWRPLSFSDQGRFNITELIFAGYGIKAPALGELPPYDSYHGLNVRNKWVAVFNGAPEKISSEQLRQINPYTSLRYKAFTAKEHGAKGVIFLNGGTANIQNNLIQLTSDSSLSGSGLSALAVQDEVLDDLLNHNKHQLNSLKKMRAKLNPGQLHSLPVIAGLKISGNIDIKKNIKRGRNVLAKLRMAPNATQIVVVGAHLDHLGRGTLTGSRKRSNEVGMIHAGADDNASGVACVLEAAAQLSNLKAQGKLRGNKDILLAAWSGEEIGVLGSSHFVKNFIQTTADKSLYPSIDAAINLDMVGHLREKLVLQGTGSSTDWPKIIMRSNLKHPIQLITQSDPYLPTDSTSFYLHGVPTLNFFTGAHDNYHTPRDKPETLNYEGIKIVADRLVDVILTLEEKPGPMNYSQVKKTNDNPEREFKIYLGTIPDYASADISGVKLSGVASNSPAEQAGLKQNDVIIKLAGKDINDIYDYTFVLNTLRVGEPAELAALRGHEKVVLTVVARYRE